MARPPVSAAVRETSGAAIRQGPHQAAQKSTSTGTRAFSTISSNNRESTSSGSASGLNVDLQAPQRPVSARCSAGIRFCRPQVLQVRTMDINSPAKRSIFPWADRYRSPGFFLFSFLARRWPVASSFFDFCNSFLDCDTRTASLALTRRCISRSSPVSGMRTPNQRRQGSLAFANLTS